MAGNELKMLQIEQNRNQKGFSFTTLFLIGALCTALTVVVSFVCVKKFTPPCPRIYTFSISRAVNTWKGKPDFKSRMIFVQRILEQYNDGIILAKGAVLKGSPQVEDITDEVMGKVEKMLGK